MAVAAHSSMAKSAPSSSPMSMCHKHEDAILNSPTMNWIWSFLVSYRHSPSVKIKFIVATSYREREEVLASWQASLLEFLPVSECHRKEKDEKFNDTLPGKWTSCKDTWQCTPTSKAFTFLGQHRECYQVPP